MHGAASAHQRVSSDEVSMPAASHNAGSAERPSAVKPGDGVDPLPVGHPRARPPRAGRDEGRRRCRRGSPATLGVLRRQSAGTTRWRQLPDVGDSRGQRHQSVCSFTHRAGWRQPPAGFSGLDARALPGHDEVTDAAQGTHPAPRSRDRAARTGWPASRRAAGRSGNGRSGAAGSSGKSASRRRSVHTGLQFQRCNSRV